jgi:hypothetical protein
MYRRKEERENAFEGDGAKHELLGEKDGVDVSEYFV